MRTADSSPATPPRFLVDVGDGQGLVAFASVRLPDVFATGGPGSEPLVLRRAVSRDFGLYRWWDAFRRNAHSAPRTVTVQLHDADGAPQLQWVFYEASPVSLGYSPLDAAATDAPVLEILSLAFERFELL
jgi:phage tail-like protein